MKPTKSKRNKVVKAWIIIWKHNDEILESYHAFLHSIFPSRKLALRELKAQKWPNYSRDLKIIPCTIHYQVPKKLK